MGKDRKLLLENREQLTGKADGARRRMGRKKEIDELLVAAVGLEPTTYGL
jgi:hypothetical protein